MIVRINFILSKMGGFIFFLFILLLIIITFQNSKIKKLTQQLDEIKYKRFYRKQRKMELFSDSEGEY